MSIERKTFTAIEVKVPLDAPLGTVDAYVSASLNEDYGGDIVQPGAFKQFTADVKSGAWPKWPTLLFNHGIELGLAAVTGKVVDMEDVPPGDPRLPDRLRLKGLGGLWARTKYNLKTQAGRDAYEHRIAGDISDYSYMYEAPDTEIDSKGRRLLKKIYPVFEISDVLVGMNPETFAVSMKSLLLENESATRQLSEHSSALREAAQAIAEQVEGMLQDPEVEVKGAMPVLTGMQAGHQYMFNQAVSGVNSLIGQELAEPTCEYDDIQWLAQIASSLVSWAFQENVDVYSTPAAAGAMAATDHAETKEIAPVAEEVVEEVIPPVEEEINLDKVAAYAKLALIDLVPHFDLSEFVPVPEPLDVLEESGTHDGLTNWARQRTRH
jgi:hypothetical protein